MLFRVIPRRRINLKLTDLAIFARFLFNEDLLRGKYIEIFEAAFADYVGTKHAIAASSGRTGLSLILKSLDLSPGDEIILPAFTFNAVPKVVRDCGFTPIFVDISNDDYNINVDLIEKKINKKTKALIATHIFGSPCNIDKVMEIASRNGLKVIEDCAQAIGATYKGRKVGAFGHCGFFSFESVKPFSTFGGGAVVTDDSNLAKTIKNKLNELPYPRTKDVFKRFLFSVAEFFLTRPFIFIIFIYPVLILSSLTNKNLSKFFRKTKSSLKKFEIKFTNFQAFIGIERLRGLNKNNSTRVALATLMTGLVKDNFKVQKAHPAANSVYYSYVAEGENCDDLSKKLLFKGVDTDRFFNHDCSNFYKKRQDYPITQKAIKSLIQLPMYHQLSRKDIIYIAGALNDKAAAKTVFIKKSTTLGYKTAKARILRQKVPLFISWALTDRCNYSCKYCNIWKRNTEELGTGDVINLINKLSKCGTEAISFAGGEPLLREDIGEIIRHCRRQGIYTKITTNGSLIPEKIKEISDVNLVKITLNGPRYLHDSQRQLGSYQAVMDAVDLIKRSDIDIGINCVISKENIDCLDFVLDKARKLRVKVSFQPLESREGFNEYVNKNLPEPERFKQVISGLIKIKRKGNSYIANSLPALMYLYNWPDHPGMKCWAGQLYFRITPMGSFTACDGIRDDRSVLLKSESNIKDVIAKMDSVFCRKKCWRNTTIELNYLLSFKINSLLNLSNVLCRKL